MNAQGILDLRLAADLTSSGADNTEKCLEEILGTLECMETDGTPMCYADALYSQIIFGDEFADWLYNYNLDPELSTFKKELSKRINKGTLLELPEYQALISCVDAQVCDGALVFSIHRGTDNPLYVATPAGYWGAKQWYLSRYVKHSEFSKEMPGCFPNLFFHELVAASLNTLNADFTVERPHIVRHLQALNDFKDQFALLRAAGTDHRQLCVIFQANTRIECAPQASRQSAKKLDRSFYNTDTGQKEILRCELHTKLKWDGMDRVNQDRIYFHPGKPEIAEGKVLIAHIGTHQ